MKDDDDKPTMSNGDYLNVFTDIFFSDLAGHKLFAGIDWVGDENKRGDIIRREGNVTHVRFKG